MTDHVEAYRSAVSATRRAATARNYGDSARRFVDFLAGSGRSLEAMPVTALAEFAAYLGKSGVANVTVRIHAANARRFLGWVRDQGTAIPEVRLNNLALPRVSESEKAEIPEETLAQYMQIAAEVRDPVRMVLLLLPLTGVRVGSLVQLRLEDCEWRPGLGWFLALRAGAEKTGAGRIVPLHPAANRLLLNYLKPQPAEGWAFRGRRAGHLAKRTAQDAVLAIARAIGYPLHPHLLRHAFATRLRRSGATGKLRNLLMGHSAKTTADLYDHYSPAEQMEAVARMDLAYAAEVLP